MRGEQKTFRLVILFLLVSNFLLFSSLSSSSLLELEATGGGGAGGGGEAVDCKIAICRKYTVAINSAEASTILLIERLVCFEAAATTATAEIV
jgi:hypothetical protein